MFLCVRSFVIQSEAKNLYPKDVYLLNKQGDNLSRLGEFSKAIECYDNALKIEPDNEYILNNKAIALLNSGQIEEALVEIRNGSQPADNGGNIVFQGS